MKIKTIIMLIIFLSSTMVLFSQEKSIIQDQRIKKGGQKSDETITKAPTGDNLKVKDAQGNFLMGVIDEGAIGSIWLPQGTGAPADVTNKIYSVNGKLFYNGTDLSAGGSSSDDGDWTIAGNNIYTAQSGKVGIGTSTPTERFHIYNGTVLFEGTYTGTGIVSATGSSSRMMWDPFNASFRAGRVSGNVWDPDSIGSYSAAFNFTTKAKGAMSTAFGEQTIADSKLSFVLGRFNVGGGTSSTSWVETDPLFEIGIGPTPYQRENAFTILKNGNVGIGTPNPTTILNVVSDDAVIFEKATILPSPVINVGVGNRMFWYPKKYSFRVGYVSSYNPDAWDDINIGDYSFATGMDCKASGNSSVSMGRANNATGLSAVAIGMSNDASGKNAVSFGNFNKATGDLSMSLGGYNNQAIGDTSLALGYNSKATAAGAIAMGGVVNAQGKNSVAIGHKSTASGIESVALGYFARAIGAYSFAVSKGAAYNLYSFAFGDNASAQNDHAIAIGKATFARGIGAFSAGYLSEADGDYSTALGYSTSASGNYAIAVGRTTVASGLSSTAMGYNTVASGTNSTAIGSNVKANGSGTLFIGDNSVTTIQVTSHDNRFVARFSNGYKFYTNSSLTIGAQLLAGSNSWAVISDSTKKENFKLVDGEEILNKISQFKLTSWNYKTQDPSKFRHYGPMAQDFYSAFGNDGIGIVGNDTTIASADFDGINFIAIQALEKRSKYQESRIKNLEEENKNIRIQNTKIRSQYDELKKEFVKNTRLETKIELLEQALNKLIRQQPKVKISIK